MYLSLYLPERTLHKVLLGKGSQYNYYLPECRLKKATNFRRDMIGMFTYNGREQGDFINIDWFHYQVSHQ